MVAQFPQTPVVIDPWLVPQLNFLVNIVDVEDSEAMPIQPNQVNGGLIYRHSRIVEIRINAKGIQVFLIKDAIKRIFDYAVNAVTNDINITSGNDVGLPLKPYSPPTNNPRIFIDIDVNRSKQEKTVDLVLNVFNLEANCITETFNKLFTYIEEAVTTDLNPNI